MTAKEKKEYFCPKCGVKLTLGNCYNFKRGYSCIDCAQKRRIKTVNELETKTIYCRVCSKELAPGDIAIYPTSIICSDCDEFFRNSNYYIAHTQNELSFRKYSATLSLLVLISVVYLVSSLPNFQQINTFFLQWGALVPELLYNGQYWRLITPNFLHADLYHLFSNALSIAIWGHLLERYIGSRSLFVLILLSCVLTTTFSAILSPDAISLGASGIAYGLMTAFVLYAISLTVLDKPAAFKGQLVSFMVLVVVQIAYNYYENTTVDVWGHLGGAVSGLIFILLFALIKLFSLPRKPIK